MLLQIGGGTIFTAAIVYIAQLSPMDSKMLLAVATVLIGTLLACASQLLGGEASSESPTVSLPFYLLGLGLALASTLLIATCAVVEELVFQQHRRIDPLQFSAIVNVFGTVQIAFALLVAQFVPGHDHGVQVASTCITAL